MTFAREMLVGQAFLFAVAGLQQMHRAFSMLESLQASVAPQGNACCVGCTRLACWCAS